jgi:hypothetical protein
MGGDASLCLYKVFHSITRGGGESLRLLHVNLLRGTMLGLSSFDGHFAKLVVVDELYLYGLFASGIA